MLIVIKILNAYCVRRNSLLSYSNTLSLFKTSSNNSTLLAASQKLKNAVSLDLGGDLVWLFLAPGGQSGGNVAVSIVLHQRRAGTIY